MHLVSVKQLFGLNKQRFKYSPHGSPTIGVRRVRVRAYWVRSMISRVEKEVYVL